MIETIYTDFTTKLLPKIAEGLTITKDYFMDLFGRYAKFLFIRDLTYTILCLLAIVVLGIIAYKLIRKAISDRGWNGAEMSIVFLFIPIGFAIAGFIQYGTYTIQDAYVPEIRIYQEIKGYISPTQH